MLPQHITSMKNYFQIFLKLTFQQEKTFSNMLRQHITSMKNHFQIFLFVALELNTEQDGCRLVFTL